MRAVSTCPADCRLAGHVHMPLSNHSIARAAPTKAKFASQTAPQSPQDRQGIRFSAGAQGDARLMAPLRLLLSLGRAAARPARSPRPPALPGSPKTRLLCRASASGPAPRLSHSTAACVQPRDGSVHGSVYMRPLPADLVGLSSPQGTAALLRALAAGTADAYVPLSAAFQAQSDVRLCGAATLAVVLNALGVDPETRRWRGVWRWHADDAIACACAGLSPATIREHGTTLDELCALAACHGLAASATRAEGDAQYAAFRAAIAAAGRDVHLAVAFSRAALGQTDDGHTSPVAAYDAQSDSVLVLDVARFKYAPYWVPVRRLFDAMRASDAVTGRPRGFVLLARPPPQPSPDT